MTEALISTVLKNLSKDKYERASDIARRCNCSSIEVKEILINLLEKNQIECKGLRWKQLISVALRTYMEEETNILNFQNYTIYYLTKPSLMYIMH